MTERPSVPPTHPEPSADDLQRLFAIVATILSSVQREGSARFSMEQAVLIKKLRDLRHPTSSIEWALYRGAEQGYLEFSVGQATSVEDGLSGDGSRNKGITTVCATDALWDAWRSGKLTVNLLRSQSTNTQGNDQTPSSAETERRRIALAFSGGGFRATLFHLGVLAYLHSTDRLRDVSAMVAVSGGSILAAHVANEWNRCKGEEFREVAADLVGFVRSDLRDKVLVRWLWSRLLPWRWSRSRTHYLYAAYRTHFGDATFATARREGAPLIAIVATDGVRQERVVFTSEWILRFPLDEAKMADSQNPVVTLSDGTFLALAVTTSSCFPPIFSRMKLSYEDLGLHFSEFKDIFRLNDGGVTGNLAVKAMLSLKANGYDVPSEGLACDAERPLWAPSTGLLSDSYAQSAAISQSERDDFVRVFGEGGKLIRLSERVPDEVGLPFRVQTFLARFRTDLDAPSWQEVHALLLHGAMSAANKLGSETIGDVRGAISAIIESAGGPSKLPQPREADLAMSYWRPKRRILLHAISVLAILSCIGYGAIRLGRTAIFGAQVSASVPTEKTKGEPTQEEGIDSPSDHLSWLDGKDVQLSVARQFGSPASCFVGNAEVPFAYIEDSMDKDINPTFYATPACLLRFYARKNVAKPCVLDSLRVVVHSVDPLPEYKLFATALPTETNLYWVDVHPPMDRGPQDFLASRFFSRVDYKSIEHKFAPIELHNKPQAIDLRINATKKGIYTLSVKVKTTDGDAMVTSTVIDRFRIAFDFAE